MTEEQDLANHLQVSENDGMNDNSTTEKGAEHGHGEALSVKIHKTSIPGLIKQLSSSKIGQSYSNRYNRYQERKKERKSLISNGADDNNDDMDNENVNICGECCDCCIEFGCVVIGILGLIGYIICNTILSIYMTIGSKQMYDLFNDYSKSELKEMCDNEYTYIFRSTSNKIFEDDMIALYITGIFWLICIALLFCCGCAFYCMLIGTSNDQSHREDIGAGFLCCAAAPFMTSWLGTQLAVGSIAINFLFTYYDRVLEKCDQTSEFYQRFDTISNTFEPVMVAEFTQFLLICLFVCCSVVAKNYC